jgi:hypothetical protein
VVAAGHCGLSASYLCVGVALVQTAHVDSVWRIALGAMLFAFGAALVRVRPPDPRRFAALRAACVLLLIAGTLGVVDGLGHGFRGATGQFAAAAIHGTIGLTILSTVQRQKIRARLTDQQ